MIEVKNLSKQFKAPTEEKGLFGPKKKAFWAVKDLGFQIKKGSVASICLLYTSPSPRDGLLSRMPSSA